MNLLKKLFYPLFKSEINSLENNLKENEELLSNQIRLFSNLKNEAYATKLRQDETIRQLRKKISDTTKNNEALSLQLNSERKKYQKESAKLQNSYELEINNIKESSNKEIERLTNLIESLNSEISSKNQEEIELNSKIDNLESEVQKLQKTLDIKDYNITELDNKINSLETIVGSLYSDINHYKEQIKLKNTELLRLGESYDSLVAIYENTRNCLITTSEHAETLSSELEDLKKLNSNLILSEEKHINEIKELTSSIEKYKQVLSDSYSNIDDLETQIDSLNEKCENHLKNIRNLEDLVLSIRSEKEQCEQQIQFNNSHILRLQTDNNLLVEKLEQTNRNLNKANTEIDTLSLQISNDNDEISYLENLYNEFSSKIESLNEEIHHKNEKIDILQNKITDFKSELARIGQVLFDKELELNNSSARIADFEDDQILSQRKISELNDELKLKEDIITSQNDELKSLKDIISEKEREIKSITTGYLQQIESLRNKMSHLEETLSLYISHGYVKEDDIDNTTSSNHGKFTGNHEKSNESSQSNKSHTKNKNHSAVSEKEKPDTIFSEDSPSGHINSSQTLNTDKSRQSNTNKTNKNMANDIKNHSPYSQSPNKKSDDDPLKAILFNPRKVLTSRSASQFESEIKKDFPKLNFSYNGNNNRSIRIIFDCKKKRFIDANKFFSETSDAKISCIRERLEEAEREGVPYFTCAGCGTMVKIGSHRTKRFDDEIRYFIHSKKGVDCPYSNYKDNFGNTPKSGHLTGDNRGNLIKNEISNALSTNVSKNKGITEVEKDKNLTILGSKIKRLTDISAKFGNLNIAFEIVNAYTSFRRVHDKDLFYTFNNYHVFWIFGSEAYDDYNELVKTSSKDIIFTGHRNVFIFDSEAIRKSQEEQELYLKCNWLDPNDQWHYTIEKDGKNGILVPLNALTYLNGDCRPFYVDADIDYYNKHPEKRKDTITSKSRIEQDYKEIELIKDKYEKAILEMNEYGEGVEPFENDGLWGFKYSDVEIIEPYFDNIRDINDQYAIVSKNNRHGVVSKLGDLILQPIYEDIYILPAGQIIYSDGAYWRLLGYNPPLATRNNNDIIQYECVYEPTAIYKMTIIWKKDQISNTRDFYFVNDRVYRREKNNGKWSILSLNKQNKEDLICDNIEITPNGNVRAILFDETLIITPEGYHTKQISFSRIQRLPRGFLILKNKAGNWGLSSPENDIILPFEYFEISKLNNDYLTFRFKRTDKIGICNYNGETIVKPLYERIHIDSDNTIILENKNENNINVTYSFDGKSINMISKDNNNESLKSNTSTTQIGSHKVVWRYTLDKYICERNGQFGIISKEGTLLVDYLYDSIENIIKYLSRKDNMISPSYSNKAFRYQKNKRKNRNASPSMRKKKS